MNKHVATGFIFGSAFHHLDHLAPFCLLLNIPLIVTEKKIEKAANYYYPQLVTFYKTAPEVAYYVTSFYQIIFSSLPQDLFDKIFFVTEQLLKKKLLNIWLPHGNSDKGHQSFFMEGLKKEKIVLVYGKKMIDFLKEKKVSSSFYATVTLGNYRLAFYKKMRSFYDQIASEEVFDRLPKGEKTLFYGPTWNDAEKSSSLNMAWPHLLKALPSNWNLIIKIHPNMMHEFWQLEPLFEKAKKYPNVLILKKFPPIYPLLSRSDIYLGDMSSIGYDFLSFNRPLFFLNQNKRDLKKDKGVYLFRCGTSIDPKDYSSIFSIIQSSLKKDPSSLQKRRQEVYNYVFGKEKNESEIQENIENIYTSYLENVKNPF